MFDDESSPKALGGVEDSRALLPEYMPSAESMQAVAASLMEECWDLPTGELLEQIRQWEQLIRWAQGCQVALVAALFNRTQEGMLVEWLTTAKVAGEELGHALALGTQEGASRAVTASAMVAVLGDTHDALVSGEIDYPKAALITTELEGRSAEVMQAVQEVVLPLARTCSRNQLRSKIAKALIEVDPKDADRRHLAARERRRVCRPRRMAEGMASIWMVLPAQDAVAIDNCLNAAARSKKAEGDPRSMDQLRADAISALAHYTLDTGAIGDIVAGQPSDGFVWGPTLRAASAISITIPFDQLLDQTGIAELDWPQLKPLLYDTDLADEDHDDGGDTDTDGVGAGIDDSNSNSNSLGVGVEGVMDDRACIAPELAGYGPIPPMIAGILAMDPGSVWRRLITDPATGALLDVGRRQYRPPAHLAEHVLARDGYCIAPRCQVKAIDCDLDHTIPFDTKDDRGTTSAANLAPLCRHHHLLKTFGGWTLTQEAPGQFRWTSPTGHTELITSNIGLGS